MPAHHEALARQARGSLVRRPAPSNRSDKGSGMFRWLMAPTTWEPAKWLAYAAFMIVPGSLLILALWCIIRVQSAWAPAEQYLAEASDLSDLERRMRVLERTGGGPVFMTFNH